MEVLEVGPRISIPGNWTASTSAANRDRIARSRSTTPIRLAVRLELVAVDQGGSPSETLE